MTFTSWPGLLGELAARRELPAESVAWAMEHIMSGEATSAQIAAFVMGLRAKGETAQDIDAMLEVMLHHALPAHVAGVTVDTCGTGGDGAHTVNISTMAAIVVAACGLTVVKHGNRAASSKCGSADVLETLGVSLDAPAQRVSDIAAECGITFFFAPMFHPALKHAGPTRREIGIPTAFNILGPLANPARPRAQVVGVANPVMAPIVAEVLQRRGTKALVVRGHDGLDELSTHTQSTVWVVLGDKVEEITLNPLDFGIEAPTADALAGGDAQFNAQVVSDLFAGKVSPKLQAIKDAVCFNAAAALVAADAVEDAQVDVQAALSANFAKAKQAIESGSAAAKLQQWIAVSAQ
ncbi:MAG: anthranilate phosphoribosyltransferase [Actinomycetota bacterium]|jgi:anthranilate phosphoribosyltransferase